MVLQIQPYTDNNEGEWDNFVNSHPDGRFSQLIGYKRVLEKTYGFESSYWLIRNSENKVVGVFPCFIKRSAIFGSKLISQPFSEYGGPLFANLGEDDLEQIKYKLTELLIQCKLPFLEIHGGIGLPLTNKGTMFFEKPLHTYAVLRLSSVQQIWEKQISQTNRTGIRKAERSGLVCCDDATEKSLLEDFFPLYLRSMKRFGTPPHASKFFVNRLFYLKNQMKLILVKYQKRTIHTLLGFTTGRRLHIVDMPTDERYWEKGASDLACWELIKWAVNNGYEYFDFGPARYAGQQHWKKKWGAEFFNYSYFYLTRGGYHAGDELIYSKTAALASSIWKRTVPLRFTSIVGPSIRKRLGD